MNNRIALVELKDAKYPTKSCSFRPGILYPEYPFGDISTGENQVYDSVRSAFHLLNYDHDHFNTRDWNPLGEIVKPGMTVLIKPNMVMEVNMSGQGENCLYTHPSVIAPIIDYVCIALGGRGRIILGDAPVQECDFDVLLDKSGYGNLIQFYRDQGINIEIVDFRGAVSVGKNGLYSLVERENPRGIVINLGENSAFYSMPEKVKRRLRITNYNPNDVYVHHLGEQNEYYISSYALEADVIINVPKPKTHRLAGITGALKNFVGISVRKEYLPHHTIGSYSNMGDESDVSGTLINAMDFCVDKKNYYQAIKEKKKAWIFLQGSRGFSFLLKPFSSYRNGGWYGNRTISKTINDINKIVYYADKNGKMQNEEQRRIISIADMVICGQGNGPLRPMPKETGMILVGENPVCFDTVIAAIMGFDDKKIPTIGQMKDNSDGKYMTKDFLQEPIIYSNQTELNGKQLSQISEQISCGFIPSDGWKNHIEKCNY